MQYHGGSIFDWSRPSQGNVTLSVPARYHLVPPGLLPKVIVWGQRPQGSAPAPVVVAAPIVGGAADRRKKRAQVGGKTVWFDTPEELAALRRRYRDAVAAQKAAAERGHGAVVAEPPAPLLGAAPMSGFGLLGDAIRAAYQNRGVEIPEIDHAAQRLMVRKRQDEEALMLLLSD